MTFNRRHLVGLLFVPLLTLGACSSDETSVDSSPETTSEEIQPPIGIGETGNSDGVELKVEEVWSSPTVTLNGKTKEAPQDGKYIYVKTTGKNDGKNRIRLVCDGNIDTVVTDSQGRTFDALDRPSDYNGNPQCGDRTQPGFDLPEMTYLYLAPGDAEIETFQWYQVNQEVNAPSGPLVSVNIAPVETR